MSDFYPLRTVGFHSLAHREICWGTLLVRRFIAALAYPPDISLHRRFGLFWRLCLESHFLQQPFDPPQSLVTLNGEMERLTIQLVMWGVKESDDRPWLTEVAPGKPKDIVLPPRLFRRDP